MDHLRHVPEYNKQKQTRTVRVFRRMRKLHCYWKCVFTSFSYTSPSVWDSKKKVGCDQLIKLGWICFYPSLFFVLVYMRKFTWQTHHRTMSVWRTCGDNSLPDLLMARGVGSATGASWSGTIFASSSTLAPPARLHRTTLAATSCYYTFRIEPRPVCCSFSYCSFLSGRQTQISS